MILTGNIIMLVASVIMMSLGLINNKKHFVIWQTIQLSLMALASIFLGSIPGVIADCVGITRNMLSYKNKLTRVAQALICVAATLSVGLFNNLGWLGFFPWVAAVLYTLCMNTKNLKFLKFITGFTCLLWAIHDFSIQSYVSFAFDIFSAVTCAIGILRKESHGNTTDQNH